MLYKFLSLFIIIVFVTLSCRTPRPINKTVPILGSTEPMPSIIPMPNSLQMHNGTVYLRKGISLVAHQDPKWQSLAQLVATGLQLNSCKTVLQKEHGTQAIKLTLVRDERITTPEGYELHVKVDGNISIHAAEPAGAFYGFQSLMQSEVRGVVPCMQVTDTPRFPYRGMHLDVSRHFFPVSFIKQYIDLMAQYKMNNFHWHLTDDQGWRIEIKKYTKLQEVAAFRKETLIGHYNDQPHRFDGNLYGGYYTQEEVKDIVEYAQARYIQVIPEIELPGHAQAALAAYPEYSCTGGKIETATSWGVFEDVYCPTDTTFSFLEDVLSEVIQLFPSQYIHIGGDECPKVKWENSLFCQQLMKEKGLKDEHELQSYFIKRIGAFIERKGRKFIGWDEILEGGLAPGAIVMSWRGTDGGIAAAKAGHDVIMTPTSHCYFDYYQSDDPAEPLAIGGYLPLEKVYAYEPIPMELSSSEAKYVLGTQANLWTEYLPTPEKVLYLVLPRMQALAEVAWTQRSKKNYTDFVQRLQSHFAAWDAAGLRYADKTTEIKTTILSEGKGVSVAFSTGLTGLPIFYGAGDSTPITTAYLEPLALKTDINLRAVAKKANGKEGRVTTLHYQHHKAAGKKIMLTHAPAAKYGGRGAGTCFNGINGSNVRYGDSEWLGFEGKDFEAVIDFGEPTDVTSVNFRCFNGTGQWIYLPTHVEIFNEDISTSMLITSQKVANGTDKVITTEVGFGSVKLQKMRIKIHNFGVIPNGAQGAGYPAWLFVDEVKVN